MSEDLTINAFHVEWIGERAPFAKAFVAAQKATEAVKKASTNPAFRSKYADLAEVVEAVVPALNAHGIGVLQFPGAEGGDVLVTTELLHESGASVRSTLRLKPVKTDPQGVGSAVTYGRRYSLLAVTGAAPEDDDGNAASKVRTQVSPSGDVDQSHLAKQLAASVAAGRKTSSQAKKDGDDARIKNEITNLDREGVRDWHENFDRYTAMLPIAWLEPLHDMLESRLEELNGADAVKDQEAELDAGFRGAVHQERAGGVARNANRIPAE